MRNIITMIVVLGLFISIGFYFIYVGQPDFTNKGKKALINGKDTCIIQSEEKPFSLRVHPRTITVLYKDNYGQYKQQAFQEDLITIIK